MKHRPHAREQQIKHARTEENVITVDELASLLSQEGQKQTLRQISREIGLTQSSVVPIIHRDLGQKCLSFTTTLSFLKSIFCKVV